MKIALIILATFIVAFLLGCFIQDLRSGYTLEILETKEYDITLGTVTWSKLHEYVGMPFLDTGKTMLEFEGRKIYRARRGFQESFPYAEVISTEENTIEWQDGEYHFRLEIQKQEAVQEH